MTGRSSRPRWTVCSRARASTRSSRSATSTPTATTSGCRSACPCCVWTTSTPAPESPRSRTSPEARLRGARLPGPARPAHRARQPAQPAGRPPGPHRRRHARAAAAAPAVRPRRLQELQRHLRPPGRRRAAEAHGTPPPGRARGRASAYRTRRRVLRAQPAECGDHEVIAATAARRSPSAARLPGDGLLGSVRFPTEATTATEMRCARPTAACTGARAPTAAARPGAERGRAAEDPVRAQPRPRRVPRPGDQPRRSRRRPPRDAGRGARAARGRPRCTTSARPRSRTASWTSRARSTKKSGVHAPPHVDRRAHPVSRPGANAGLEAMPATMLRRQGATRPDWRASRSRSGARIIAVCDAYDAMVSTGPTARR